MSFIKFASLAAFLLIPLTVIAQNSWKPERSIELVVGSNPGTGTDKTARIIQRLWQDYRMMNVASVVVNKPGGGGAVSWAYLNQHAGDGHYLLVTSYNIVTNHITGRSNLSYRDFTPIALLFSEFIAYSVRADSAIRNVSDLLQQLRKDPASVPVGISSSIGGANHIALGLFMKAAGIDVKKMKVVVFNSGAESVTALLGGHVGLMVASGSAIAGQFVTGKLRPLAFAAPKRLSGPFATVPTLIELGLQVTADNWRLVIGPKGLGSAESTYWDTAFKQLTATEEWNKSLEAAYLSNNYLNSGGSRKYLDEQYDQIKTILTELGLARPVKQ